MIRNAFAGLAAVTLGAGAALGVPGTAQAEPMAKARNATLATALSGSIPCSIGSYYDLGCGRMKNGRLKMNAGAPPYSHIEIKDIDGGGRKTSVRLLDVAGDSHKEAVVLISAYAGGVGWPNYVIIYDGNGNHLTTWDSGAAIQAGRKGGAWGAREATSFSNTKAKSVDIRVRGIATGKQCEACGTGVDTFRLSKGKNGKPQIRLITRR